MSLYQYLKNDKTFFNSTKIGGGQNKCKCRFINRNAQFLFPSNPNEQQKIASCLSALDELITAQLEKIEQLQQHKKGLMQGLFPKSV